MGFMTLTDFRNDLQSALGEAGHDNDKLDRWINAGLLMLTGAMDFEVYDGDVTIPTVTATASITAPVDAMVIKAVKDVTTDYLLRWIKKVEYHRLETNLTGTPKKWTRHADKILLHPVPSSVVSLKVIYKKSPARLTAATDKTQIDTMWDPAIHMLSVYMGWLAVGQNARARDWLENATNYINSRLTESGMESKLEGLGATKADIEEIAIPRGA